MGEIYSVAHSEAAPNPPIREPSSDQWSSRRGMNVYWAVVLFVLGIGSFSALIYFTGLLSFLVLLLMIPAVLSAFYYGRGYYLPMIGLVAAANIIISYFSTGLDLTVTYETCMVVPGAVILAEVIHQVTLVRRKTENALQTSEVRFRRFVEQSQDGILLVEESGSIVEWNRSMESISGIKRVDAMGRPYWDVAYKLLPEEMQNRASYAKIKATMMDLFQTGHFPGANVVSEREITRTDGSLRRVQELVFPIKADSGYMAGTILRDISDRKAAEQTVKETNEKLTTSVQELQERNQEAALLNEMGDMLQSCLTVEDAYEVVSQFAANLFVGQSGILFVLNDSLNQFERQSSWGEPDGEAAAFGLDGCWALRRGKTHVVSESSNRLICQHIGVLQGQSRFLPYLCIPMTAQGETLGVLHIQTQPGQSIEKLEQRATPVAVRVALALANLRLRETLRSQSIRDPLTGLFNRRYMEETLERELHRAARHKTLLGVLMIDIDHFKLFNDTFGHDIGDALLEELGSFLRANVRSEDVPCRYGGEEFIIILPEANLEDTVKRANQLRQGITGMKLQRRGKTIGPVTISQGVAGFPDHGASAGQLIQAVDAALYRAKRGGRDRVVVAEI
jgi:diguanylate cyclase (GGDEF)-like protein/PAS domain S-box-containing protein